MTGPRCNSRWLESGLTLGLIAGACAALVLVTAGCEQAKLPAASVGADRATVELRTASHETSVAPVSEAPPTVVDQDATSATADDGTDSSGDGSAAVRGDTRATGAAPLEVAAAPTDPIAEQPAKPTADAVVAKSAESTEPRECTFDTVKFNMEKGDPFHRKLLTPQIEALDGQRIRIRGYMLPSVYQRGLTEFVLVRDNMKCCFGPGAALFDCMFVQFEPGKTTDFSLRPVAVEGVFSIRVLPGPDGYPLAIYHLLASDVR